MEFQLEAIAAIFTAIVAMALALIGFIQQKHQQKRNYTFDLLYAPTLNNSFLDTIMVLKRLFDSNKPYTTNQSKFDLDESHVVFMLNYFQALALGLEVNILDRNILIKYRGMQMAQFFAITESYIYELRTKQRRPKLYSEYRSFVLNYMKTEYENFKQNLSSLDQHEPVT